MATHELKTDSNVFQLTVEGKKDYEIRYDDRDFAVGDILMLKETKYSGYQMKQGKPLEFTGRSIFKRINSILTGYGLKDGWVILNVEDA